jgi:hypothetical protein
MFPKLFKSAPSDFDILVAKLNEIYSLLAIAKSNQEVIVEFYDVTKPEMMKVSIAGHIHFNSANPMSELREFHNILALNIKQKREILITIK